MKTLFIVDSRIDSPGVGGAERSLREMIPFFREHGVEPLVACFRRRGKEVDPLEGTECPAFVLDGLSRFEQVTRLRQIIVQKKVDLVHTTLFQADVFGRTATAATGVPVVTSLVNMPYEAARLAHDRGANRAKLAAVRLLEAGTGLLFADHYHAITQAVKDAAVTNWLVPPERVTVVYRGRDERRLGRRDPQRRERVRRALGVPEETYLLLNAARQEYQKGQTFLLGAMARLVQREPRALLLIAGRSGGATAALEEGVAASGLSAHVRFLGHRSDVPDLMAAADAFALSSLWEGLGCVLLEALALELPVVASDLAPVSEVLDEGRLGMLVAPGDPAAMADGLLRMRREEGLASGYARRGREAFEARFTTRQSAQGMVGIFRKAIQRKRDRTRRRSLMKFRASAKAR